MDGNTNSGEVPALTGADRIRLAQEQKAEQHRRGQECFEFLRTLHASGDVFEARALVGGKYNRKDSGFFDDPMKAAEAVIRLDAQCSPRGIYVSLNPHDSALLARSKNRLTEQAREMGRDENVVYRRWLFVDVDPKRPSGICATSIEKQAAVEVAESSREWLMTKFGYCEPIELDSGNGRYLLFPIDIPNDEASKALVRDVLKALAADCNTDRAEIDTNVHDASRILRLPGTFNRKGDSTDDRPHRVAGLVYVPDYLRPEHVAEHGREVVSRENLEAVAALVTTVTTQAAKSSARPSQTHQPTLQGDIVERARRYLAKVSPAISGQGGHPATLLAAEHLVRGFGLSDDDALTLLTEWNQYCSPPWSEHELRHKISEARDNGTAVEWGQHLRRDSRSYSVMTNRGDGDTTPANCKKGTPCVTGDESENLPPYQPFPTDLLPAPISEYVRTAALAMGCDDSYLALPLLTGLAAAVGCSRRISLKRSWCEPCVFWTVIVGESGTMKSPALSQAVELLRRRQTVAFRDYDAAKREHEVRLQTHEAAFAQWKKHGHKTLEPPPEKPDSPVCQRWIVEDATVESVAPILEENPRGLLVFRDELSGWVNSFDGYKATRGADVAHWLSMHRAGSLIVDRKTGQRIIHVPRASVSVTGGIQPATLVSALGGRGRSEDVGGAQLSSEHVENGLAARLLMTMPPKQAKRWTDTDIDEDLSQRVDVIMERLTLLEFQRDESGELVPVDLSLMPDAKARWISFYNEHADETVSLDGATAAAWSKLEGYAARFSLLVHLLREAIGCTSESSIELADIDIGIALSRWFGYETRRIYAALGIDSASTDEIAKMAARRIVAIAKRHDGVLTVRKLQRSCREYRDSGELAEKALQAAEQLGFFNSRLNTETGGRPVSEWVVAGDTSVLFSGKNNPCVTVDGTSKAAFAI